MTAFVVFGCAAFILGEITTAVFIYFAIIDAYFASKFTYFATIHAYFVMIHTYITTIHTYFEAK